MLLKELSAKLASVQPSGVFASADSEDPRLGNLAVMGLPAPQRRVGETSRVVAILGVPQHIGVERNNGRPGAGLAPDAIRTALYKMAVSGMQSALTSGALVVADVGNLITEHQSLEELQQTQHDIVVELLRLGVFPIVLGGGHDVAWPTLHAYETMAQPYGVINIDAHADVRRLTSTGLAHSGSAFRQMLEHPNSSLVRGSFVEYGLQPIAVANAHVEYVQERGGRVVMLADARNHASWMLAMQQASAGERMHITLDMDCFASAFAPGVSAPSADGFTPSEIGSWLREAARNTKLSSFDVVEVSPPFDADGRTSKLAAAMIMEVLQGLVESID